MLSITKPKKRKHGNKRIVSGIRTHFRKRKKNKRILRRKLKWRTNSYKHAFLQSQIIGAILRPFKAGLFKVSQKNIPAYVLI